MLMHEYQAKRLLRSYGVPVPHGGLEVVAMGENQIPYLVILEHPGQTVRAHEENIAVLEGVIHDVDDDVILGPQGAGDDVSVVECGRD